MQRTSLLRRTAPVAVLAAAAVLLAGCGSEGDGDNKSESTSKETKSGAVTGCDVESGKTSDSVKVTGEFGKEQKATFPTPLEAKDVERSIVIKGDGEETAAGDQVDTLVSAYIGADAKSLGSQPLPITVDDKDIIEAFAAGVACVPYGSRVVVTVPAKDMYGEAGNEQAGIKATDTVVIITDVISKKEPLKPAAWTDAPEVKFDDSGKPTVTLAGKPAADLELKVLEEGTGEVVKAGDQVTVDYQGTSWNTKKIFDQSYGKQPATFGTDQVVPGFGAALVGQKVGSKVIVTIPPKYAYGEDKAGHELGGQTLVFVIDIKSTAGE